MNLMKSIGRKDQVVRNTGARKIQSGKYFRVWPIDSEELENILVGVFQFIMYFVHSI